MGNEADDLVRAQYERWVYPAPISDLTKSPEKGLSDPDFLSASYWPDRPPREALQILVAGCGPNAAPRLAFHHPKATVVGVDISEASLEHARHLKAKHRLDNLTLLNCRIEEVTKLGLAFDFIDCSGVLHHLSDPAAGLKILGTMLRPDGVIFLMLYAKYGRAGIYMLQELFRMLEVGQAPSEVAFVRHVLDQVKLDHPVRRFESASDLRYDAGLVDMFLHPRDRAYTVADCLALAESAELRFQGWEQNHIYYPELFVSADSMYYRRLQNLPEWKIWQLMELFHGGLSSHCFYACRRDRDPASYEINFIDDCFMDRVPIPHLGLTCSTSEGSAVVIERPGIGKIAFRGSQAAIARSINGRRTVRACLRNSVDKGSLSAAAEVSICRDMCRTLWRLGFYHFVHETALE